MVGLGGHHVPTLARERIARLSSGPAASITDTLTHPTTTNETSRHFAEALLELKHDPRTSKTSTSDH
jgi:hypothetical protein